MHVNNHGGVFLTDLGLKSAMECPNATEKAGTLVFIVPEMFVGKAHSCNVDAWSAGITVTQKFNRANPYSHFKPQGCSFFFLFFFSIYFFTSFREQVEAYMYSLRWSAMVGLKPAHTCILVTHSTTVPRTLIPRLMDQVCHVML